jgi:hypothetical protein
MRWLDKYWIAEKIYRRFYDRPLWQEVIVWLLKEVLNEKLHHVDDRKLLRCDCGELLWVDSPNEIQVKHLGHRSRLAQHGTPFEFISIKMGWIK